MAKKLKKPTFSPSHMDRIAACPGSHALEIFMKGKGNPGAGKLTKAFNASSYALEGTAAHTLGQWALTDGRFDARAYLGQNIHVVEKKGTPFEQHADFEVTEAMCKSVQVYIDAVKVRIAAFNAQKNVKKVTLLIEERINVGKVLGVPGKTGTADTLILVEYKDGSGHISVEDLKYGAGVRVDAENNTQLMIYGAGALAQQGKGLKIKTVDIVIHQPRQDHFSAHTVTVKQLRDFSKTMKAAVKAAKQQEKVLEEKGIEGLTLKTGKQCTFCKAKGMCPAIKMAKELKKAAATAPKANDNEPEKKPKKKFFWRKKKQQGPK